MLCGCTTTSIWSGIGVKQPARLDNLETLVHECCGVDGDFAAHVPVRVGAGLLRRDPRQGFGVRVQKRTSGSGQDQALNTRGLEPPFREARGKGLEQGIVLRVDRHQLRAALFDDATKYRAGDHHGLLVGQQQPFAKPRGVQRRWQARSAHDGRHDRIHRVQRDDLQQGIGPGEHPGVTAVALERATQLVGLCRVADGRGSGSVRGALGGQLFRVAVGGQGFNAVAVRVSRQHVQRAAADGSGRAQNRYAALLHSDSHQ